VAVIRNPMFGQIKGTLGAVTFCVGSGKTVVRSKTTKKVKHNQNQIDHCSLFKAAKNQWNSYSSVQKSQWLLKARIAGTKLNGFQYFIKITLSGETEMPTNPTLSFVKYSISESEYLNINSVPIPLPLSVPSGHKFYPIGIISSMIPNSEFVMFVIGNYYELGNYDTISTITLIRTRAEIYNSNSFYLINDMNIDLTLFNSNPSTPMNPLPGFTTLDITIFYLDYTL
jgi:hypothetical protein